MKKKNSLLRLLPAMLVLSSTLLIVFWYIPKLATIIGTKPADTRWYWFETGTFILMSNLGAAHALFLIRKMDRKTEISVADGNKLAFCWHTLHGFCLGGALLILMGHYQVENTPQEIAVAFKIVMFLAVVVIFMEYQTSKVPRLQKRSWVFFVALLVSALLVMYPGVTLLAGSFLPLVSGILFPWYLVKATAAETDDVGMEIATVLLFPVFLYFVGPLILRALLF